MKLVREAQSGRRGGAARRGLQRKPLQGRPPGASRFSTNASLERQADEAADGMVRKQRNVARTLTPAAPASYDAPSSPGAVLPSAARAEMEQAFGADLSDLRVHHDGAAHAAARHEEARAFTAGRDVYFGQGTFDPGTVEGKRLLAHEVAHVIQQTGRRLSSTLVRATAQEGQGELQKEAEPQASARKPRFMESPRRYAATLARLRAAGSPGADERPVGPRPRRK